MSTGLRVASIIVAGVLVVIVALEMVPTVSNASRPGGPHDTATGWIRAERRDVSWVAHLDVVDQALGRGDVSAAVRAWHDANGAARASRQWDAMVQVGDAFLRIGAHANARDGSRANARHAYLAGLLAAQRDDSVDGVLRVAQAFDLLGDRVVAAQCVRIAGHLAGKHRDQFEIERVAAFAAARRLEGA